MDCQEVRKKLPEYIDGELEFEQARRIRSHLTRCYFCNEELAALTECLSACRQVLHHPYARERFEQLSEAVHAPESTDSPGRFWRARPHRLISGPLAAAFVVVLFSLVTSAFVNTARSLSEPLSTRAVLNEKPELSGPVTTVAWNAYLFRSAR
ncbi:MAG TPA: zf-HC2 domain-containing protein [Candidatus Hydrogenedentes bacterium]|nr:zf-HC2 domain-containing protein [Candidatus Hydrogenedentota bacterium]HQE82621.1 zf-HC2 domain-containing protein [Candidatus Hydrogenedentota bacterium]HQH51387.1 zf-HC2 domain-containing protein [Candidatus Hydrogenedentota bacterium]HQM50663.1 zf-HC2 domain-containing protein [Candidatus Hydrogenedentota bacterium]